MEWPEVNTETYEFATTATELQIWKRAADAISSDYTSKENDNESDARLRSRLLRRFQESLRDVAAQGDEEKQTAFWRANYRSILYKFVELMASSASSPELSLDVAQAGIDAVHDMLLYRIDARTVVPAKDVFVFTKSFAPLGTLTCTGTAAPDLDFQFGLVNPASPLHTLYGMDAVKQVEAWYEYGCMETSASVLAKSTLTSNNVSSVVSKKVFVLLGCTAALGPARALLKIPGVRVLGVARGGSKLDDLLDYVRNECPDDATFEYPKSPPYPNGEDGRYPNGGACLLTQGPQIAQWILDRTSTENEDDNEVELVLVPLATSPDGEEHVRLAASMDLIIQRVLRARPNISSNALWTYTSPTLPLVVPPLAATAAKQRWEQRPTWEKWANTLSRGSWLEPATVSGVNPNEGPTQDKSGAANGTTGWEQPTINNNDYVLVNGIVTAQGPCYVLAKMLQQWRCMVAYYRDAHIVSAPFAPPTRTPTMLSSDGTTNALTGMHHFEPLLAFDSGSASTLMCAILIAQLQLMNRPLPDMDESPFTLFWEGAAHGGVWTCPYTLESISVVNYALGKSTYYPYAYIPPAALADFTEQEGEQEKKKIDPDVLLTLTDSQEGHPMPDSVKERLEFM